MYVRETSLTAALNASPIAEGHNSPSQMALNILMDFEDPTKTISVPPPSSAMLQEEPDGSGDCKIKIIAHIAPENSQSGPITKVCLKFKLILPEGGLGYSLYLFALHNLHGILSDPWSSSSVSFRSLNLSLVSSQQHIRKCNPRLVTCSFI